MRKIAMIILGIAVLTGTCVASGSGETGNKPVVSVSILPQKFFVEQIAKDYFQINVILPPGASPEDFEPTPKQIKDLSNSSHYFYVGHLGFEKTWVTKAANVSPKVKFVSCSTGLDLLDDDHNHAVAHKAGAINQGTDPHIWTSPENVKTISRTICSELSKKYPNKKTDFENNLQSFISKIDSLDNHIRVLFNDSINHSFMIFHPALSYFARDYHLEQYPIEFDGKSPSTAHMKSTIDIARKKKINTIFIQSQFETAKAGTIAKEIDAKVVSIDPLAENWLSEMFSIAKKMKEALTLKGNE